MWVQKIKQKENHKWWLNGDVLESGTGRGVDDERKIDKIHKDALLQQMAVGIPTFEVDLCWRDYHRDNNLPLRKTS